MVCWILLILLLCIVQVLESLCFWTIFLQWLWGRRGVPCCIGYQADQGVPKWRSGAYLPCFSYVRLLGAEPLLCYLCTTCVNSSVDTIVLLVSSIIIITSILHCAHDEWCVMIIYVWRVFSKLLRPSWISKYIVKTGCNSITVGCKGCWLFYHQRRTTRLWWSRRPSPPLFV